jgi:hypothetical protein
MLEPKSNRRPRPHHAVKDYSSVCFGAPSSNTIRSTAASRPRPPCERPPATPPLEDLGAQVRASGPGTGLGCQIVPPEPRGTGC